MNSMYSVARRRITRFVYQQTGTYNNQVRRSYELTLDGRLQSALESAVVENTKLLPQHVVSPTSQLITPSTKPEGQVGIINGWETPRLRFWLEAETEDQMGQAVRTTLQGYSEYADLSMNGLLDPKMRFYINNVSQARVVTHTTALGEAQRAHVIFSSQMLHDTQFQPGLSLSGQDKVHSMTPEKVFGHMGTADMHRVLAHSDTGSDSFLVDTTTWVSGRAEESSRTNLIPGQYVTDILNTYVGAKGAYDQDHADMEPGAFYNTCAMTMRNTSAHRDDLLSFLENRRPLSYSLMPGNSTNSFTYEDLTAYDLGVGLVTRALPSTGGLHQAGQTANWADNYAETLFAHQLVNAVGGLMAQYGVASIGFKSTNMLTVLRGHETVFHKVNGINSATDMTQDLMGFRFRLENEVLNNLSYGGQMGYEIEVNADLAGETWVLIRLDGQAETMFVLPTFCDALLTPVVTGDQNRLSCLASELDTLGDHLSAAKIQASFGGKQTFLPSAGGMNDNTFVL